MRSDVEERPPKAISSRFRGSNPRRLQITFSTGSVKAAALRAGLPEDFLDAVLPEMGVSMYKEGDVIYKEGERVEELLLLAHGEVDLYSGPHGSQEFVVSLSSPTVLGEICSLRGKPQQHLHHATVHAKSFCDCRSVPLRQLLPVLAHFPQAQQILETLASDRLEKITQVRDRIFSRTFEQEQKGELLLKSRSRRFTILPAVEQSRSIDGTTKSFNALPSDGVSLADLAKTYQDGMETDDVEVGHAGDSKVKSSQGEKPKAEQAKKALAILPVFSKKTAQDRKASKPSQLSSRISTLLHPQATEPMLPLSFRSRESCSSSRSSRQRSLARCSSQKSESASERESSEDSVSSITAAALPASRSMPVSVLRRAKSTHEATASADQGTGASQAALSSSTVTEAPHVRPPTVRKPDKGAARPQRKGHEKEQSNEAGPLRFVDTDFLLNVLSDSSMPLQRGSGAGGDEQKPGAHENDGQPPRHTEKAHRTQSKCQTEGVSAGGLQKKTTPVEEAAPCKNSAKEVPQPEESCAAEACHMPAAPPENLPANSGTSPSLAKVSQ